jgi:hypothetical protein
MRVYKERGSNDVDATRFRFDPHGWLRTSIQKSGRERLHGPSGSFLIDQGKATSLEGREHEQDRKEILETLAVSRNFLALADPRALRIASLVRMPAPPVELPAALAPAAAKLEWLAVESPDFHLVQTDKKKRDARYRVQIGLDPASGLPRMATVAEIENGAVSLASQPQLVELKSYEKLDGFQVPKEIVTYPAESQRAPWGLPRPAFGDAVRAPGRDAASGVSASATSCRRSELHAGAQRRWNAFSRSASVNERASAARADRSDRSTAAPAREQLADLPSASSSPAITDERHAARCSTSSSSSPRSGAWPFSSISASTSRTRPSTSGLRRRAGRPWTATVVGPKRSSSRPRRAKASRCSAASSACGRASSTSSGTSSRCTETEPERTSASKPSNWMRSCNAC